MSAELLTELEAVLSGITEAEDSMRAGCGMIALMVLRGSNRRLTKLIEVVRADVATTTEAQQPPSLSSTHTTPTTSSAP